MLVWINGPFGVGKTATAYELQRRLPGSAVYDPEHVGFGMRRMLPAPLRGNFQDLPAWRHSVTELLRLTLTVYDRPVIVPMTLADQGYHQEIIARLRSDGFTCATSPCSPSQPPSGDGWPGAASAPTASGTAGRPGSSPSASTSAGRPNSPSTSTPITRP